MDDEALRQAQRVVGLYGDPDVTWGICLELLFTDVPDLTDAPARLTQMVREHPALGRVPEIERVPADQWEARREECVHTPFVEDGRLVRLLVREDGHAFFVVVHHGVSDGLGMVAIAGILVGRPLASQAQGVGDTPARTGFLLSSVMRLGEALLNPPARFGGHGQGSGLPERLDLVTFEVERINGARLTQALLEVHDAWPRGPRSGGRRFLLVMGASRRARSSVRPDRDTAYLRVPLSAGASLEEITRTIRETPPEPDFPETSAGGVGPWIMRRLKSRLGYTVNLANLGVVTGEGLAAVGVFPAVNGPQALGVGLVTVEGRSTLTVRTRRGDFTDDEALALRNALVSHVGATLG